MSIASRALSAASGYLRRHPGEISRAVRNLLGLRAGLPVDALRWLMEQAAKGGKIEDPVITEVPPGLRVTASVDLMKTPVDTSSCSANQRAVTARLRRRRSCMIWKRRSARRTADRG